MATRMYFYIDSRNQRQGPVQANQLPMLGVTLNTYVWTEGMKDWDRSLDDRRPVAVIV